MEIFRRSTFTPPGCAARAALPGLVSLRRLQIPLVNGRSYTSQMWRISADSIAKLIAGESKNNPWILLPLDEPENLVKVLPTLTHASLLELDLFNEFYKIYGEVNAVRNTDFFVKRYLDEAEPDDLELRNGYQERSQKKVAASLERFSDLMKRMFEFENPSDPAINPSLKRAAWLDFCRLCTDKFDALREQISNTDPATFKSLELLQDKDLERSFGRYLNTKYRNPNR